MSRIARRASSGADTWSPAPKAACARVWFCLLVAIALPGRAQDHSPSLERQDFSDSEKEFFESKIRPILKQHCWECHASDSQALKAGLRLDSRQSILAGGDSGPAAIAGQADRSLLIAAVHYQELQMPPQSRLLQHDISKLEQWVAMGLPWGVSSDAAGVEPDSDGTVDPLQIAEGRSFWSLQPVELKSLPNVSDPNWPQTRIDYFVLSGLDQMELEPSAEADKRTLVRRLYFDLLGLPPTMQAVEQFVSDNSPTSYQQLVERLLASPAYGERWARHWLDVARYAEDHPNGALPPRFPHKYRDWVVQALNSDLPYTDFIRRQLAADTIAGLPREELAALGFLGLSPTYLIDEKFSKEVVETIKADEWEEKVDVITRGLLGLTVACARCHDHKFDPITSADYYALAGVMASTQLVEMPLVPLFAEDHDNIAGLTEQLRFHEQRYQSRFKQRQGLIKDREPDIYRYDKEILESASEIQRITSLLPENYASIPRVNAVRDAAETVNPEFYVIRELVSPEAKFWRTVEYSDGQARNLPIQIRGSVTNLGETVPRRFIELLSAGTPAPFRQGSGRRELAEAILNQSRQLTGRVLVNRVWGWHFGNHLVGTPSNFGSLGDSPTHIDLLDDLTFRFIEQGWSIKQLHREIVLSSTYRQASRFNESNYAVDPGNSKYWRMNRRRLEVEAWRDAMLQAAGRLDERSGGESFDLEDAEMVRRTLYGRTSRQGSATLLRLFDFPELTRHTETRTVTTTPLQQLYFLNNPFVIKQANAIASQIYLAEMGASSAFAQPEARQLIAACYHLLLQREPSAAEIKMAHELLDSHAEKNRKVAWLVLVQSLMVSSEFLFVD